MAGLMLSVWGLRVPKRMLRHWISGKQILSSEHALWGEGPARQAERRAPEFEECAPHRKNRGPDETERAPGYSEPALPAAERAPDRSERARSGAGRAPVVAAALRPDDTCRSEGERGRIIGRTAARAQNFNAAGWGGTISSCGEGFSLPFERAETMRHKTYMPTTDSGVLIWAENFERQISAAPPPGISTAEISAYTARFEAYAVAHQRAKNPSTRGVVTVKAKDEAKAALVAVSRRLAMGLMARADVEDDLRATLGLTVRRPARRSAPPAPAEAPRLLLRPGVGRRVQVQLYELDRSFSAGRPAGVVGATLMVASGRQQPTDLRAWSFERNTTATRLTLTSPEELAAGGCFWVMACWLNARLECGPWSDPQPALVGWGAAVAA